MKKLIILTAAILSTGIVAMAQTANVKKANNLLLSDPVNYDEARSYIDAAKQDATTSEDPKTWYVAGRIGYTLANQEWNKRYLGQTPDADLLYTGLDEMYSNYLKADELDGKELDKKGNPKYTQRKGIKNDFKEMHNIFIDAGASQFDARNFDKAYTMFIDYVKVADLSIFDGKDNIKIDTTYNQIKYYAALAAFRSEKNDEALTLLNELSASNYSAKQSVYELLVSVYQSQNDTTKYIKAIKDGMEAYPQNTFFIGSLVNYCVSKGKYNEALSYVDKVIATNPKNIEYINVKAELLNELKDFAGAKKVLEDALANNRTSTGVFLLGKCWATEGSSIQDAAQDLTDNNKYNEEMAKAKECYKSALKYFVEAKGGMTKADANYEQMLQIMKALYLQVEGASSDNYKAIDDELKSL
ncbi:MAG: hypothetical protein MJ010_02955 [Paludibacteraceae bacterium]|nr:hypothetical protein [Paludibacteraceae bacterium]